MDIPVSLPLDSDGFLRRECPNCGQQFKWHHGPANEEAESVADPTTYYCPLCGAPAGPDDWWTEEQLEYVRGAAMPAILQSVQDELAAGLQHSKYVKFEMSSDASVDDVPSALTEPDDMSIVVSPCHAYEPVKVPDDASESLYCLVCGSPFAV